MILRGIAATEKNLRLPVKRMGKFAGHFDRIEEIELPKDSLLSITLEDVGETGDEGSEALDENQPVKVKPKIIPLPGGGAVNPRGQATNRSHLPNEFPRHTMLKQIKRAFGFGEVDPRQGNTIVINAETLERRVALLEDGQLEEYNIEREGEVNLVGSIFKGQVKNIEQGLKAMFVDIGMEKNAFLHFWDAIPAALDNSMEEIQRSDRPRKKQKKITSKDIPSIYPIGSEIMIQVSKGPIGTKGTASHHQYFSRWSLPGPDAFLGAVRNLPQDR